MMSNIEKFMENPCIESFASIKKGEQTKAVILRAIGSIKDEPVLAYTASRLLTKEICAKAFAANRRNFEYIPDQFKTEEMYTSAVKDNGEALCYVPKEYRTYSLCYVAVENDKSPDAKASQAVPEELFVGEAGVALYNAAIKNNPAAVEHLPPKYDMTPVSLEIPAAARPGLMPVQREAPAEYQLAELVKNSECPVYYISDIHLEHQLGLVGPIMETEIRRRVRAKVLELTEDLPEEAVILFAGDICHSPRLHQIFQEEMSNAMNSISARWRMVYVLGNHELWDGDPAGKDKERELFEVARDYRVEWATTTTILENSLLVRSPKYNVLGQSYIPISYVWVQIPERWLLEMDAEELRDKCKDAIVILGGTGFAGLNQKFNATAGIYRNKVSRVEELSRTTRFNAVYQKLMSCAADIQVIVLTHMPTSDWLDGPLNPNWIYVNGHTHQNTMCVQPGKAIILADNQVGYKPRELYFNRFFVNKWADLFKGYPDGVHVITNDQYIEFQHGRGIPSNGCNRSGTLYMVKRGELYMFFLDGKSLYILNGGRIKKADHPIEYYYEHLAEYVSRTEQVFIPYRAALAQISKEVKSFGGTGKTHGSIVDIDYYSHIFLDPFTGIATPYFALDKGKKIAFTSVYDLLNGYRGCYQTACYFCYLRPFHPIFGFMSPRVPGDYEGMLEKYKTLMEAGSLCLLPTIMGDKKFIEGQCAANEDDEDGWAATSTVMYKPSAIMRGLQYTFDHNVVRVWNDAVLEDVTDGNSLAPLSLPGESK